jgi:transposase
MKRKKFSKEFKAEAVKLALSSDENSTAIAARLGISKTMLYNWIKLENQPSEIKDIMMKQKELLEENKRLKKELAKSKQVEEILKKAAAYFAKEAR